MKRIHIILTFLSVILVTGIIYSNSLQGPFQFDDVKRIVDIRAAQSFDIKETFQYSKNRFLLYLTYALNFYLGKENVMGYHVLNLIIHIISSILVFLLALCIFDSPRLSSSRLKKDQHIIALFAALIFSTHPIQTESVTYIWQRGESMAGMFYLLAVILYARFRLREIRNPGQRGGVSFYALSVISIVLCSLTKPVSATLPIAILFYEMCFMSKNRFEFIKAFKKILPILALAVVPILLARYDVRESEGVGVRLTSYYMPYYYTKLRVLCRAFFLMLLPVNQTIEYNFTLSTSLTEPILTFYSLIFHLSLIVLALLLFKHHPLISFAIGWFYLILSGTTILFLDDLFFEHYLYLPLFGYALLLPMGILNLGHHMRINRKWAVGFLILLSAAYSAATYNRNRVWQTEISLWEDAVKKSPSKPRPNYTLGVYYFRAKRYEEALKHYELALRYKPLYPEAYYRLGEYYFHLGNVEKAAATYKQALEIKPEFFEAHLNLGFVYLNSGDYARARRCLKKALELTGEVSYIKEIETVLKEISHYE